MSKAELTKRAIAASFRELLETMPLEKITVSSIAERTGINRQTFYYHFHDIYDLVSWIYRSGIEESVGSEPLTLSNWHKPMVAVLNSLRDNHDLVVRTMHGVDASYAYRFAQDEVSNMARSIVKSASNGLDVSDEDLELVTQDYSAGLVEATRLWVSNGMRESPVRFVSRLGLLLDGAVTESLKRLAH